MRLRGRTVGAYLAALRDAASVPGATEYTLRPPLIDFLHAAAHDLELAPITVHPELRLRDVGQPDLQERHLRFSARCTTLIRTS